MGGSGGGGSSSAVFTMTQLAAANRVYQRTTLTGGGQAKGQGTVPVTINASVVGTVYARRRSVSDGVTIVQAPWLVTTLGSTGSQALNVTGVDVPAINADAVTPTAANDGAFYIDLQVSGGSWLSGTTAVTMGDLTSMWGQSQLTYFFTRIDAVNIAGTISPYGRVFAQLTGYTPGAGSVVWELPADAGNYKGAAVAEYMRCMVSATGVAHACAGFAASGTLISTWQSGQSNMTTLLATLAAAGGSFRFEYSIIGTTDAQVASADVYFRGAMDNAWTAARGANAYPSPIRTVASIPAVASLSTTGDWTMVNVIRQAAKTWAAANSSTYIEPLGTKTTDGTHQTNGVGGGDYFARELFRSYRSALGLSGTNAGPTVSSITRTGAVITINLSSTPAAITGTPHKRFRVFDTGNQLSPRQISSSAIVGSAITITLSADPGNGAVLDLYPYTDGYQMQETGFDLGAECFFDQNIQADETTLGFTRGRQIDFATIGALNVPAPGSGVNTVPAFNLTMTTPTYQAGATGFGQELASGSGITAASMIVPQPQTFTFEGWITCPVAPGANSVVMCPPDKQLWIGFNSSGQLMSGLDGNPLSATVYAGAGRIFVRMVQDTTSRRYYVATTQGATPTLIFTKTGFGTSTYAYQIEFGLGVHTRSDGTFTNATTLPADSVALFSGVISTVAPSASYVGNEAGLIALYNFENNGNDSCTN